MVNTKLALYNTTNIVNAYQIVETEFFKSNFSLKEIIPKLFMRLFKSVTKDLPFVGALIDILEYIIYCWLKAR